MSPPIRALHPVDGDGLELSASACRQCGQPADGSSFDKRRRPLCTACGQADRLDQLAARSPRMRSWSFETYPADAAGRRVRDQVLHWTGKGLDEPAWEYVQNLYLWGPVGAGKTGIAWPALCYFIVELGLSGDFVNVRDLLAGARSSYSGEGTDPLLDLDGREVLVLDDLGAERPTEWALETLATLLERRHSNCDQTIVTSNYSPAELIARLGRFDEVGAQRIVSRLVESCTVVNVDAPDRRLAAA